MGAVFAVILAGGSGTRFWPASRRLRPKQLLAVGPKRDESLIAATVRRVEGLCSAERIFVATGAHLLAATRAALPWLPPEAFLGEPVARNTAACIGWATTVVKRLDPDALVIVLPSDHYVADQPAFQRVLERALACASRGVITTIGITPNRPETGYGYIELGAEVETGTHQVARFVEKPALADAERYLASGRYLWNAGLFVYRAQAMLDAIAQHMSPLHQGLRRIERAAAEGPEAEERVTREVFESLPSISIDYGVMERQQPLQVVAGDFGWTDLGSWQSSWELGRKDGAGNVVDESALLLDSSNNLVRSLRSLSGRRVIAAIGVEDLCILDTDDALLVIPRSRAQDVRLIVEALSRSDRGDYT